MGRNRRSSFGKEALYGLWTSYGTAEPLRNESGIQAGSSISGATMTIGVAAKAGRWGE